MKGVVMTTQAGPRNDDVLARAISAHYRTGGQGHPVMIDSGVEEHDSLQYVVLRSGADVLAVYRIQNTKYLRQLRRWPKEIEQ
jgi:hypothetical protein